MSDKKTLFDDFQKIQKELKTVGKNTDGFNYRYADIDQVWSHVRNIIQDNNFIVINRIEDSKLVTNAVHKSGEELVSSMQIIQTDPQKKGAEITYYRRYNLLALFNIIVAGEDTDAKDTEQTTDQFKAEVNKMTDLDGLRELWASVDEEKQKIITTRVDILNSK